MSKKIHILSEFLMKRIAAGEVIERPASVVKELLENSIDAGATSITLAVKDAGTTLIQVTDNGSGMSEQDTLLCIERHATSKISDVHDLDEIATLGFRGEALASIGTVSRMTISSRTVAETEGTQAYIEDGEIREVQKVASNPGTTIKVQDLFYNVPARRKFQKSAATELRHIMVAFRRIALAYPELHFKLFINDDRTTDLPSGDIKDRIRDLLGPDKAADLVYFNQEIGSLKMEGFVSRPGHFRRSRDDQYFFLNKRAISHKSLVHSVLSSYGTRLGSGEYPIYLVYISMEARFVDVNVHPTKSEVRFADEKYLHDALFRAVRDGLKTPDSVPDLGIVHGRRSVSHIPTPSRSVVMQDMGQLTLDVQKPATVSEVASSVAQNVNQDSPLLWQVHNRYILSQIKSGLTIIDQHAAHERILYEWALKSRENQAGISQQLLFPQTVQLLPDDFVILTDMLPGLEKIGFVIKDFGNLTVVIEAVPLEVKAGGERELLQEMIEEYRETQTHLKDRLEAVAASFACKAAIKSGDKLTQSEMASLIDRLFASDEPYYCPHGRPVVVNLSLQEIDHRFGR